ncbi:hypothetical protein Scep_003841 [Stephania cephalantha]|uniref:DNA-(apurinic or apyrimidinic site) endonuclease n=1 Tax=Stephania cephalantha TaxID=152367 RepID=A0AAP0PUS7_9MAGN
MGRPRTVAASSSISNSNGDTGKGGEKVDDGVDIQSLKSDIGRIQAMTVRQLRLVAKNFGIPARGSKNDLVSALKCFLEDEKNESTEHVPSEIKSIHPEQSSSPKDETHSCVEVSIEKTAMVSEVSEIGQKRRRGKPSLIDSIDDHPGAVIAKEKLSTKLHDNLEIEPPPAKRSGSSHIVEVKEEVIAPNGAGLISEPIEPWTMLAHKKPQQGWIPYNPRTMRPPLLADGTKSLKLISWNVNGLKALLKADRFLGFAQKENFDVLCMQETKLQDKDVEKIKQCLIAGYENSFWTCSVSKLGYSGTAIISRLKPLSVRYGLGITDHDTEGRLVTVEYDTFYLICGYVPNSGEGLRRLTYRVTQWDPSLSSYMKELEKSKPVILTGDLNCAHQEIDIYNPAGNRRSAGFTDEERKSLELNFLSKGYVDTFRRQHPGVVGYTYWGYRHGGRKTNKGWRLDYFLVSESIADKVHDSYILPDVTGSDHCPVGLILKL